LVGSVTVAAMPPFGRSTGPPGRWWSWLPLVGLVVQAVRVWRGFRWLDEPARCPRGIDAWHYVKHSERQLLIAIWVTAGTLVTVIVAMLVRDLLGVGR
jgi:hypothetical protein